MRMARDRARRKGQHEQRTKETAKRRREGGVKRGKWGKLELKEGKDRKNVRLQLLQIKLDRFLIELSPLLLLNLLFLPSSPARRQKSLSPGQPTYHYGNPLNHSETLKKKNKKKEKIESHGAVVSLLTGRLPYHNHIS